MISSKEGHTILDLKGLKDKKIACLTLDVEQDYAGLLSEPTYEGLMHIPKLVKFLKERNISLTCFVQGSLFETHPAEIEQFFSLDVEFELHSYSHPGPTKMDFRFEVKKGKQAYRRFFARDPLGYRSPLGFISEENDWEILVSNGFKFDSSIFPSLRPGIFDNRNKPTEPYFLDDYPIIEFPFTVFSDTIRIPIALSYMKLFGKLYFYSLKFSSLPKLIVFDFHLHDLFKLPSANGIFLEKRLSFFYRKLFKRIYYEKGDTGFSILNEFIQVLQKKGYLFLKLADVYKALLT